MISRKKTKTINIGTVAIGGNNPIAVQSRTKTFTSNVAETVKQIKRLEEAGCQIVRCAVPDTESAYAIDKIKKKIRLPLVADIHFDYKLAIIAAEMGADKLRINPGNIGSLEKIKAVVSAAKERGIPIRVGVNSGSLEKKYKHPTAKALVESALSNVRILEKLGFYNIIVAVKSTSVPVTIEAYRLLSQKVDYPLHIGVTESGIPKIGTIKSSVGIGALLAEGIGNTLRVSLTGDPVEEVRVGYEILKALELYKLGVTVISCPTCGRTDVDVATIAGEIEARTRGIKKPLTIAVMGCEVNGPGEAAEADLGLACGKGVGLIFRSGKIVKKVAEAEMVEALMAEVNKMIGGQ